MPDNDNVTPLRSVERDPEHGAPQAGPPAVAAEPEEIRGPGWTGRAIYEEGAPPRVAASEAPPGETMPDPEAAAADLERRVHGPEPSSERQYAKVGEPTFDTREPGDDLEPAPGGSRVLVASEPAAITDQVLAEPAERDSDSPPNPEADAWRETAREYAGNAEYWRGRAEKAEKALSGVLDRDLAGKGLADALEALAGTVRPLVPRLPVKQREPLYQAHGRALEVLAEYRKAGP